MEDATLLKVIESGGGFALLAIVLIMLLRFVFERLKSWGTFAEKIAAESVAALKSTQTIAAEAARCQQAFTDTIGTLVGTIGTLTETIRDLAITIANSAAQTTKEHAAFQTEVASLKRELRKPPDLTGSG